MLSEQTSADCVPRQSYWRELVATGFVVLLIGWIYVGNSRAFSTWWVVNTPGDYYEYQTEGFVRGHLYASVAPNPALARLPDPYDPVANAPYRIHDMTYFQGRYYLYFGVTPVVLLFLPWRLLTGTHITEPFAATLFCLAGFCVGLLVLRAWRRHYCPDSPLGLWVVLGLAWGLGSGVAVLILRPVFYHVPIACAFFLLMAGLAFVFRACHAERLGGGLCSLAMAGVSFGLTLGARPNYLLGCFCLLVPIAWKAWTDRGRVRLVSPRNLALLVTAFGPILIIGLGLMAYNYARFGSLAEFGMRYQLAGERMSVIKFLAPDNIPRNALYYLFSPGLWSPYFPFFEPAIDQPIGALRYFPVSWIGLVVFLLWRSVDGPGKVWVVTVASAAALNLVMLCSFFGHTDRYPPDFQGALMLAGVASCLLAVTATRSRILRAVVAALALVTAVSGLSVIVHGTAARASWKSLERLANWPHYAWLRHQGKLPGRLHLTIKFAPGKAGEVEPLIDTGGVFGWRDFLSLEHLGAGEAQLKFFHAGYGGVVSPKFALDVGRDRELVIAFGGLLPPATDPYFDGWSVPEIEAARRELRVWLDGTTLFDTSIKPYVARPIDVTIGATTRASGWLQPSFRGKILRTESERLRREDYAVPGFEGGTALKLTLQMPIGREGNAEPLLSSGVPGDGDLLYIKYLEHGRVRIGIDHYGAGGPVSAEVNLLPEGPQVLEVWMGCWASRTQRRNLAAAANQIPPAKRLFVKLNGQVLLDVPHQFSTTQHTATIVGGNGVNSTAAGDFFTGRIARSEPIPYASTAPQDVSGTTGALELGLYFPDGRTGASEPLVVSGKAGAGDLIYVRYLDTEHVLFGFDHWGVGGVVSKPVAIDFGAAHQLRLSMGSLYGSDSATAHREQVEVVLDRKVVLAANFKCHPTTSEQVTIGLNRIGGSTTGEKFYGRILSMRRVPE
jgi:hypothetical protein